MCGIACVAMRFHRVDWEAWYDMEARVLWLFDDPFDELEYGWNLWYVYNDHCALTGTYWWWGRWESPYCDDVPHIISMASRWRSRVSPFLLTPKTCASTSLAWTATAAELFAHIRRDLDPDDRSPRHRHRERYDRGGCERHRQTGDQLPRQLSSYDG